MNSQKSNLAILWCKATKPFHILQRRESFTPTVLSLPMKSCGVIIQMNPPAVSLHGTTICRYFINVPVLIEGQTIDSGAAKLITQNKDHQTCLALNRWTPLSDWSDRRLPLHDLLKPHFSWH